MRLNRALPTTPPRSTEFTTACFSRSPPDLNVLDPYFKFMYMHNNHSHRATAHLQLNKFLFFFLLLLLRSKIIILYF
jgi:hypothetical protein